MAANNSFQMKIDPEENGGRNHSFSVVTNREVSTQTDHSMQGHSPRLSKVNLFTLLSLWMELFPMKRADQENDKQVKRTGLVIVHNMKITGLHCSSSELHAGQIAVIKHGSWLKGCDLYFSRKPCSSCLKMVVNAGVNKISYWPADPEMSLLQNETVSSSSSSPDAKLDANAAERLKSNSRPHVCVLLQPLAFNMNQFVEETSMKCDFLQKIVCLDPSFQLEEFFIEYRKQRLKDYEKIFLISNEEAHKGILMKMGLENFCENPYFTSLRQNMKDLILLLATVDSSVPGCAGYGFHCRDTQLGDEDRDQGLPQGIARHCMVQAKLLAYRTEDPKTGVGAVIWAEGKSSNCDGTGAMYLIGCGYNAYPVGSEYADFPQMDDRQKDREIRKFRYIIHAEQNAITFRCKEIQEDEKTMIFVTKCPCDECVPLIKGAGIKQIYTGDLDSKKVKADISYQKFGSLQCVHKFTWQRNPEASSVTEQHTSTVKANGFFGKHHRDFEEELQTSKRSCVQEK
ncbi:cytidine and dCMP deaminase domain-containing protein 1-like isoform X1 [Acipenser ruthenus]|uniref:cytidine and dCMP deaminase domain-containing protein 1-like isoform X1 n=2 Tax=Acipenser ruthenus TaxID=7906 RepID=UPI00145AD4D5|nr:cytidine and dCMP deaminase domain-containing protein 1-like isoform X1 [Acipenser ruthenus]